MGHNPMPASTLAELLPARPCRNIPQPGAPGKLPLIYTSWESGPSLPPPACPYLCLPAAPLLRLVSPFAAWQEKPSPCVRSETQSEGPDKPQITFSRRREWKHLFQHSPHQATFPPTKPFAHGALICKKLVPHASRDKVCAAAAASLRETLPTRLILNGT